MDGTCHLSTKFIRTGHTQFPLSIHYQPQWPSGLPRSHESITEGPLFTHEEHETCDRPSTYQSKVKVIDLSTSTDR